ncbi:MAG TPA: helix-turn-helix domain-containing protein [Egibacteraceae bacterium]|nr:helix-turn-helix domain-containing protein [Egibacteraceae bacterium]
MTTGIGEALRAARRQQGRSLADAAAATRVRESYLAALEEEEFAALGGDVYVKGFLRSYARFLGLNPEPLLESYRREHERPDEPQPLTASAGRSFDPDARRGLSPLAVAGTLLFTILALYLVFSRGNEEPATVPAPAPVESSEGIPGGGAEPDAGGPAVPDTQTMDPYAPAVEPTVDDGAGLDADAG